MSSNWRSGAIKGVLWVALFNFVMAAAAVYQGHDPAIIPLLLVIGGLVGAFLGSRSSEKRPPPPK